MGCVISLVDSSLPCVFTNPGNRFSINYSKAGIVDKPEHIDEKTRPYLRPSEFGALKGNEHTIQMGFERYLKLYKKAALGPSSLSAACGILDAAEL